MGEEGKELKVVAPAELIKSAVDKGSDLDKLEKLLALQAKWEAGEAKKAYNVAMSDFKANPPKISKDRKVGYKTDRGSVGYSHASLYNVTEKINTALSKHGLSASWGTKQDKNIIVTCKITHIKGHSEETSLSAPADTSGSKNSIQAIGSTITYLERYTLLALTGLATFGQDDDAQAATEVIDDKQKSQLLDFIADKGVKIEKFCNAFKIKKIEDLPNSKFNQAIATLKAKKSV